MASPTAYQRVGDTTANPADYDWQSFPLYLYFVADDFMVSPTITPGIDKAQVFAGVRKLSDAAIASITEYGPNANYLGAFGLFGPRTLNTGDYGAAATGSILGEAITGNLFAAPISNVLTSDFDIGGDVIRLLVNGTQRAINTTDRGTGNFGSHQLSVGARVNNPPTTPSALFFNGRIYSLIVRFGATLYEPTINNTELYVSGKMGGDYVQPITGYDYLVDANGDQITDASGNPLYTQPLYS